MRTAETATVMHCSCQLVRISFSFSFFFVLNPSRGIIYSQQMKVRDLRENRQKFKVLQRTDWYTFPSQTAWEVSIHPTHSTRCEWGFSGAPSLSSKFIAPPPAPLSPPPLGCRLRCSPSTSSHPSLLRFHFNRWSSSSFHTALWENAVKENKTANCEKYGWVLFQMFSYQ